MFQNVYFQKFLHLHCSSLIGAATCFSFLHLFTEQNEESRCGSHPSYSASEVTVQVKLQGKTCKSAKMTYELPKTHPLANSIILVHQKLPKTVQELSEMRQCLAL